MDKLNNKSMYDMNRLIQEAAKDFTEGVTSFVDVCDIAQRAIHYWVYELPPELGEKIRIAGEAIADEDELPLVCNAHSPSRTINCELTTGHQGQHSAKHASSILGDVWWS